MKLNDYKLVFVALGLIGVLIIASPSLAEVISLPSGEQFSEIYLLGPGQKVENYPYNVIAGLNYSVYMVVGNHLGSSAYYMLYLKFGNETDLQPNNNLGTSSPLEPLFEQRLLIQDDQTKEIFLTFSFSDASVSTNHSLIGKLTVNNVEFQVNKLATWNANHTGFYYTMLFELWRYNIHSNRVQFDNRFVTLRLNFTTSQ